MDSFGSRDSLNESGGIPTGNVAAFRKSLETKCNENNHPVQMRRTPIETKSTAEIRKSLENLDDRKSTPPPLTKKPIVPIKKSPTVGSVAGNIFSGLKQKVKSVEQKITHHDSLDGVGGSKNMSHVADINEKGVSSERLQRDDTEFDQVERNSSILPDMRAQRAKAPKRRLPSSNSSSLGESLSYQNGDSPTPASPNSTEPNMNKSDEDLTKPKPREWEKNRAPWMDELKASQAKKTSPGIEMRTPDGDNGDHKTNNSFNNSHKKNEFEVRSSSVDIKSNSDSTFHSNAIKKDPVDSGMAKSLSSLATKISISDSSTTVSDENATNNGIGIKVCFNGIYF